MTDTDTSLAVREEPELSAVEKETIFRFSKCDDRIDVFTAEGGLMRRLLKHPEFEVDRTSTSSDDGSEQITQLWGSLPIGCLGISGEPRQSESHADVISNSVFRDRN